MGALAKKMGPKKVPAGGLSNSATKGLLDVKASLKIPVESKESAPAPMEDMVTFTKSPLKEDKSKGEETCLKKKNFKTIEKAGRVTKVGKKDRMKARKGLLIKKLGAEEARKKEVKAKKIWEKVVIVKDIKLKLLKPKKVKSTQKKNKVKKQFLVDLEFLKAASSDPQYVKNPLETVSLHLKNTYGCT